MKITIQPNQWLHAVAFIFISFSSKAQESTDFLFIGTGPTPPYEKAVVVIDVQEKNKGVLLPNYAAGTNDGTNHRSHPLATEAGMMYYDSIGNNVSVYNSTNGVWNSLGFLPVKSIVMWSGNPNALPAGWYLCDGEHGTPDLRGRFIVGLNPGGSDYPSKGPGGGFNHITINEAMLPNHSHGVNDLGHTHAATLSHDHAYSVTEYRSIIPNTNKSMVGPGGSPSNTSSVTTSSASFTGTFSVSSIGVGASAGATGGGQQYDNRPPYLVLAFIMRVN
ncbi:hypothetical protein [uncultured Imperialibacter sp.]|uniref:hypothetical protein n=1 Tax=uncultured Imperialibacter sp. TaxID=1672639 RepID=UPI0030DC0638|tara:strand:- start:201837 stop:202664 length:828 start_codon:yes stop_codon:yes gene_type:complete